MSIHNVVNEQGDPVSVIVPIDEWRELIAKVEQTGTSLAPLDDTEYLLGSPEMKKRLLESLERTGGQTWDEVRDALGL